MVGKKIDGTAIAKDIRERLKGEIQKLQETNPRFKPNLVIFQGSLFAETLPVEIKTTTVLTEML